MSLQTLHRVLNASLAMAMTPAMRLARKCNVRASRDVKKASAILQDAVKRSRTAGDRQKTISREKCGISFFVLAALLRQWTEGGAIA
ncbi:hypothetical protein EJD96_04075 [Herbaspirillum seropedicae]|uniref:hypothetical protein n=1 Tax=Herbaspirillum seropedicae TaxID=964 RepID=UPI00111D9C24|nr:hypothetical protein [Herbaspirillum seropedicae]QDD63385.1 hypothetical protein EJD96_04075 [Herbaspirillum seropedicae]